MARITGELDPRRVPDEQHKSDLGLRVAIVREGSAPGSTVPKTAGARQQRSPFEMEFEPPIRRWAWKRTTDGCSDPSVTHYNQLELSFTARRPDRCPGVCPPPRAAAGVD